MKILVGSKAAKTHIPSFRSGSDTNARVWYNGRTGEGALPYAHPNIPKDELAWETCDNCHGLSYILYY